MSKRSGDSSRCFSSEYHKMPPKLTRFDQPETSPMSTSPNNSALGLVEKSNLLKTENASLRSKLTQTKVHLRRSEQMNEWSHNQIDILKDQLKMETGTTERLQEDLKGKMESIHAAHAAQMAVESELSQVKTLMKKRIIELIAEKVLLTAEAVCSTGGQMPTPSQSPDEDRETRGKLEAAEERIRELEKHLKKHSILQREFNSQKMKLDQANVTIQELEDQLLTYQHSKEFLTMKTRVEYLEKELLEAKDIISSQLDAVEEGNLLRKQIYCLQKRFMPQLEDLSGQKIIEMRSKVEGVQIGWNEMAKISQDDEQLPDATIATVIIEPDSLSQENFESVTDRDEAPNSNDQVILSNDGDEGEDFFLQASKNMTAENLTRVSPRKACHNIPSVPRARLTNSKFFALDWDKEFRHVGKQKWKCNKCSKLIRSRAFMKDHVWVNHYGEKFQCTHCNYSFSTRNGIGIHNKKKHPEIVTLRQIKNEID